MSMRIRTPTATPARWTLACMLLATAAATPAAGLRDAYQMALQNDPTLRAARYERDAGQQAPAIARAALLPQLSLSASRSTNKGDRSLAPGAPAQPLDYRSAQDTLSLRQALYHPEAQARYQQGLVQSEYSEAVFRKKQDELAIRLVSAYFELLLAAENHALSQAEISAYRSQRSSAERRFAAGEGTRTDIAEADARLAVAEAHQADTQDQMAIAQQALEQITGQPLAGPLAPLKSGFAPLVLHPASLDAWTALALEHNPEIAAQRQQYASTGFDVARSRAGHLPRLELVASIGKSTSDSLTTVNQQSTVRSVGVQLTLPLFSGMGVTAQTNQALAHQARTEQELEATTRKTLLELRRWYLATRTGTTKAAAYDRAVESGRIAVEGTQRGLAAGIRTHTEVLDAERQYFSALRDRAQARFEFITSLLKLKATAGALGEADISEVDALLEPDFYKPN